MSDSMPHEDRLTAWVHDHGRAVRGYLLALVRDRHAADDLTQEVFYRAWTARDRYRDDGTPRAYLLRIADHLACDWLRRAGRESPVDAACWQRIEPADDDAHALQATLRDEAQRQLAAALDALSPGQRRALLLRYYGDLEFQEIARIMDVPHNTALSHARRGLLALRKLLIEKLS